MKEFRQNKFLKIISSLKNTGLGLVKKNPLWGGVERASRPPAGGGVGFAFGAFLVLGIFVYTLYASAAWTNPTASPTGGNVTVPIYVGTSTAPITQTRYGTFKLGTTTPTEVPSNLFVYNGVVSIGTTSISTALLAVDNLTGTAINAGGGYVSGVQAPFSSDNAVNLGYLMANYTKTSNNLWGGSLSGNIWSNNTGNVGIGTTTPAKRLSIAGTGNPSLAIYDTAGNENVVMGDTGSANSAFLSLKKAGVEYVHITTDAAQSGFNTYFNAGNVGIGTTNPLVKLDVNGDIGLAGYTWAVTTDNDPNWGFKMQRTATTDDYNVKMSYSPGSGTRKAGIYNAISSSWVLYGDQNTVPNVIIPTGNVGIGTTGPAEALDVVGNIKVSGQVIVGSGDLAEEFYTDQAYPAGTVLVMDDKGYKSARACQKEYDTSVIGVISENPGLVIGRIEGQYKAPVALNGVIKVLINNAGGKINQGDLLTTSSVKGEAMKAAEPKIGTIIGKVLEADSGKGWIMAIVNLK